VISQNLWKIGDCLQIDSVQFGDDHIAILKVAYPPQSYLDDQRIVPHVSIEKREPTLAVISNEPDLPKVGLCPSHSVDFIWSSELLRCQVGEGSGWDGFGYVAVSRVADDYLYWVAFFERSNGFNLVYVENNSVVATPYLGWEYVFDLASPEKITIRTRAEQSGQES